MSTYYWVIDHKLGGLTCFARYEDQFVMVNFDGDPTADSEQYNKLDRSIRNELESQV